MVKRVIKVMQILTDKNIGGAGHQLLALCGGINRDEFRVNVVLPKGALLRPKFEEMKISCIEMPYLAERYFSPMAIRGLRMKMEEFKPDIVHTHAALSGRIAAKLYGRCKIVHTRHSVFEPSAWQKRLGLFIGAANNFLSDAIIAVSPAARDNLLDLGTDNRKIHMIFNGMPPLREYSPGAKQALRKKYKIPPDAFVLAQIARLTEVKGQGDVLDAARNWSPIILMAGEGDTQQYLESRIKDEGLNNVRLLGFIDNVEEIHNLMDAQISASFGTEATSLALVQGMSLGKPAIVTDYGGNPYVIKDGENGLVIPTRNPAALRSAVEKLRTNPTLYAKLSEGARRIYKEHFTETEMVTQTESLYRR